MKIWLPIQKLFELFLVTLVTSPNKFTLVET